MTDNTIVLKPCPFCEGVAKIKETSSYSAVEPGDFGVGTSGGAITNRYRYVECAKCGATASVDIWNCRASQPAPQAPAYPEGDVIGACICGSWPGGKCLKCQWIAVPTAQLQRGAT
jgi:hypothetical protein